MTDVKSIAVLGGGESGTGAALLAKAKGITVFLSDRGDIKNQYRKTLKEKQVEFEEGQHSYKRIASADLIVKSPSILDRDESITRLKNEDKEIISEIEWGYRFCEGKIIAVTGSNGKTTTAMLIHHMLEKAGLNVALGGNVGNSFARLVAESQHDYYVLEVSSFQLDDINSFKPHISVITNIIPHHLSHYDYQMKNYVKSKFSITCFQDENDYLIYNADDKEIRDYLANHIARIQLVPFSFEKRMTEGAWSDLNKTIYINIKKEKAMIIRELSLQGKHNIANSMAAGLAGKLLNIRKDIIRECLTKFDSIEHRLEPVLQIDGIEFINDSKATNVNSAFYALESIQKPIIWIVGGIDKGNNYSQSFDLVRQKVRAMVCLGIDNTKLHKEFEDKVGFITDTASMNEAVRIAYKLSCRGDCVLLSPACASFDLFENYEDRGRQFKDAVRKL